MLTCIAGTTGRPQITLPLAEVGGLPVGLSLLGARGADEVLPLDKIGQRIRTIFRL